MFILDKNLSFIRSYFFVSSKTGNLDVLNELRMLIFIGVGRRGAGGGGVPNNLRGGPTYPLAPPIIHPPFPSISM